MLVFKTLTVCIIHLFLVCKRSLLNMAAEANQKETHKDLSHVFFFCLPHVTLFFFTDTNKKSIIKSIFSAVWRHSGNKSPLLWPHQACEVFQTGLAGKFLVQRAKREWRLIYLLQKTSSRLVKIITPVFVMYLFQRSRANLNDEWGHRGRSLKHECRSWT